MEHTLVPIWQLTKSHLIQPYEGVMSKKLSSKKNQNMFKENPSRSVKKINQTQRKREREREKDRNQ